MPFPGDAGLQGDCASQVSDSPMRGPRPVGERDRFRSVQLHTPERERAMTFNARQARRLPETGLGERKERVRRSFRKLSRRRHDHPGTAGATGVVSGHPYPGGPGTMVIFIFSRLENTQFERLTADRIVVSCGRLSKNCGGVS